MTHDPYQTYPTFANAGLALTNPAFANPFISPYAAMQTPAIHAAACNPLSASTGIPWQPLGGVQQLGAQGYPQMSGFSPFTPSPFNNSPFNNQWQNPFVASAMQFQNPLMNPILAQLAAASQPYSPLQQAYQQQHHQQQQIGHALALLGQQVSPIAQFNSPLAPQSWVGQGLAGNQGYGPTNPLLAQWAARALQGVTPWSGF